MSINYYDDDNDKDQENGDWDDDDNKDCTADEELWVQGDEAWNSQRTELWKSFES